MPGAILNTTSFPAFLKSLNVDGPVTVRGGAMLAGPPVRLAEWSLRLGLGAIFLNTPKARSIVANLGLDPALMTIVARRLRSFRSWRPLWEDLAAPALKAVVVARARGDRVAAAEAIRVALLMLGLAYGGDGYYVNTLLPDRRPIWPVLARLRAQWRELQGERAEVVSVPHARGATTGLFQMPPQAAGRVPALLGLHQLAGDHDDFALTLAPFRAAGFATLTIDLPAHGANFSGPRLQPDDELVALAALETLAGRPEVDPDRLGVIGGSLGAFFALRTAAAAPGAGVRLKACVAYASPFDIGLGIPDAVPGIRENFAWVVGARTYAETLALGRPFHLRTGLHRITCPLLLVHGQQDHICDFTAPYEIARRVTAPLTIVPLPGVDHEAAVPSAPHLAGPGIAWLKAHL